MACQKTRIRKYQQRPGAVAAAARLGVTYSHLRRVLAGERQSKRILQELLALKTEQAKAAIETDNQQE